uniref:Ribonuclease P protein component n=1 Tax=Heterorhabditis bacteriophora TaxID=37862 RepID=A0A1I7X9B7_HETBA
MFISLTHKGHLTLRVPKKLLKQFSTLVPNASEATKIIPTLLPKERREKSTEANPRLKRALKNREKLTNKLTLLGVFQTYRPSA